MNFSVDGVFLRSNRGTRWKCASRTERNAPCCTHVNNLNFKVIVRVFGRLDDGQIHCLYCGNPRGSSYYPSPSDFLRHLGTSQCVNTRGIVSVVVPEKKKLGDKIAHEVANPDNKVVLNTVGKDVSTFQCPE